MTMKSYVLVMSQIERAWVLEWLHGWGPTSLISVIHHQFHFNKGLTAPAEGMLTVIVQFQLSASSGTALAKRVASLPRKAHIQRWTDMSSWPARTSLTSKFNFCGIDQDYYQTWLAPKLICNMTHTRQWWRPLLLSSGGNWHFVTILKLSLSPIPTGLL